MFNNEQSYLKSSDYNTVVELLYNLSRGRYTQPDLTKLEECNVVATCTLTGSVLIFESARDAERVSGGKFHNYGIAQSIKGAYSCHREYVWSLLEGEYNV